MIFSNVFRLLDRYILNEKHFEHDDNHHIAFLIVAHIT
jgi:hypothetical protein